MKLKFFLSTLLTWISIGVLSAQIPTGYYNAALQKSGYPLKTALFGIITNHTALSYTALWSAFRQTDATLNGKVWDMYSDCDFTFGSEQCGNYQKECDCYNREHSFPKSWFHDEKPMYSDLFHLYPTDGKVNSMRGNYPFGEVGSVTSISNNGSKLGSSNFPGYTGVVFEPVDAYKGDFARSYFYMVSCYEDRLSSWDTPMLNGSREQAFSDWAKNLLLKWHRQDPVSQKEIDRNNAVYAKQHNRNPFIDFPQLAEKIWGNDTRPFNGENDTIPNESTDTTLRKKIKVHFVLSDKKNSPIVDAAVSVGSVHGQSNMNGVAALSDVLSDTSLNFTISHVQYQPINGLFFAQNDTNLIFKMEPKIANETLDIAGCKIWVQKDKSLEIRWDRLADRIEICN
ncbi:MAG: endonuclease, partial [Bacteroidales bacterium]